MKQGRVVKQTKPNIRHHQCTVSLAGEAVLCRIVASARKSMRLQVSADGSIEVRMPHFTSLSEGLAFVQQHESWLLQRRHRCSQQQLRWKDSVPIFGVAKTVHAVQSSSLRVTEDVVFVPHHWQAGDIQEAVEQWYRQQARLYFAEVIQRWWPLFAPYAQQPRLRIKKMRTRWGSLSQRGYINLNCLLMAMEPELIELVVVHELCHLRYFDHGRHFQGLMTELLPDWRERERRLHEQGRLLLTS